MNPAICSHRGLMASQKGAVLAISEIPLFSALKSRLGWLQARQSVLAENVANANVPGYRASDIDAFELPGATRVAKPGRVGPVLTNPMHIAGSPQGSAAWGDHDADTFEITPSGNTVVLEEEMMKVAETQLDYQMAAGLYARGVGLLKTALGRRA